MAGGGLIQAVLTFLKGGKDSEVVQVSTVNPLPVIVAGAAGPNAAASGALTPVVSAANAHGLVVKAGPGNHYGGTCVAGATGGFLCALNTLAIPAANAAIAPLSFVSIPAGATGSIGEFTIPDRHSVGVTYVFSTSVTTFAQAANPPVVMRGRAI